MNTAAIIIYKMGETNMAFNDRVTAKARQRLEAQVLPDEQVLLATSLAASAVVLTRHRVMISPAVNGAEQEISVPLRAVTNVGWKKGTLGSPGKLTISHGGGSHTYKARNVQGEPVAQQIRQAVAMAAM